MVLSRKQKLIHYCRRMKKTNLLLASFACLLLLGAGCAATQQGENQEDTQPQETGPITIGWIGPLTGEATIYGNPVKNATELAVEEINQDGGIDGRQVEVMYEDGKCNGKDATAAIQKLVNVEKVDYILGGVCSGEVLAMAPITEAAKKIILSPTATNPDISQAGDFIFRNIPADDASGAAIAEAVYNDRNYKLVVVSEQTDFAEALHRVIVKHYTNAGGEILLEEKYAPGTKDFRGIVTKAKAAGADAIVINPQTTASGGPFIKQLRELGVELPVYTNSPMVDASLFEIAGEAAEGTVAIDVPGLSEENEKATTFVKNYEERFNEEVPFSFYAASAYDGPYLLKEAIESNGPSAEQVRDYFYSLTNYQGAIGNYGFDENGDLVGIEYQMKLAKDGEFILR